MIAAHQLVDEKDRRLVQKELLPTDGRTEKKETASASCTTLPNKFQNQGKSPRSKFLKTDKLASLAQRPQKPAVAPQSFVSVQEPIFLKDWNVASKNGDKYENFKSPSLFWEIRLKEAKVTTEKAARPNMLQIFELCDVLEEYSKRLALQGDIIFPSIKEQVGPVLDRAVVHSDWPLPLARYLQQCLLTTQ